MYFCVWYRSELDMDWIHPWIGLDWVRSFVRFIVFSDDGRPSSSISFVEMYFWFSSQLVIGQLLFTARCTLVQSAVLPSHVVCLSVRLSVRLSVTLMNCDHIGWNSSEIISPSVSLVCSLFATQTSRVYSKGNTAKFSPE